MSRFNITYLQNLEVFSEATKKDKLIIQSDDFLNKHSNFIQTLATKIAEYSSNKLTKTMTKIEESLNITPSEFSEESVTSTKAFFSNYVFDGTGLEIPDSSFLLANNNLIAAINNSINLDEIIILFLEYNHLIIEESKKKKLQIPSELKLSKFNTDNLQKLSKELQNQLFNTLKDILLKTKNLINKQTGGDFLPELSDKVTQERDLLEIQINKLLESDAMNTPTVKALLSDKMLVVDTIASLILLSYVLVVCGPFCSLRALAYTIKVASGLVKNKNTFLKTRDKEVKKSQGIDTRESVKLECKITSMGDDDNTFKLDCLKDEPQKGGSKYNKYYHKYMKYKSKYLEAKKNTPSRNT